MVQDPEQSIPLALFLLQKHYNVYTATSDSQCITYYVLENLQVFKSLAVELHAPITRRKQLKVAADNGGWIMFVLRPLCGLYLVNFNTC